MLHIPILASQDLETLPVGNKLLQTTNDEMPELFLAPDALMQETELTLEELEAWVLAYTPLTSQITTSKKTTSKSKQHKKRSTRSSRRMANQD